MIGAFRSALLVAAVLLLLSGCSRSEGPPSIVLIVLDTVRADGLGAYGFDRATSPALDALAASGALFRHCVAASPWTGASVASILTGRYPDEIGIHELTDPLPEVVVTLAERLQDAGYATGAVVSNGVAGPAHGYDTGYDAFHFERYKGGPEARPQFTADRVADRALEWLGETRSPFFLHLHFTDPHEPYLPPERWRDRELGEMQALPEPLLMGQRFTRTVLPPRLLEAVRRYHDAEVAFTDAQVGRVLAQLPDDAIVVVVGDHGEEFLDHGAYLHGHTLFEELLHVPFIVRAPGVAPGTVVEEPVSHADVMPTILSLAGLAAPDGASGRALLPLAKVHGSERVLFSVREDEKHGVHCVAARKGPWKLIECDGHEVTLFDLASDPRERLNVAARHPKTVESLKQAIRSRKGGLLASPDDAEGLEARVEELRAIGYVE